jgi:hypothetical protein
MAFIYKHWFGLERLARDKH